MNYLRPGAAVVVVVAVLLLIASFFTGGPSSFLIKSSMTRELQQRHKNCVVKEISFIRAGSFIPEAHRDLPKGTTFYPVRVNASFVADLEDGSRSDTQHVTRTLYFYKKGPGRWAYEVNSF